MTDAELGRLVRKQVAKLPKNRIATLKRERYRVVYIGIPVKLAEEVVAKKPKVKRVVCVCNHGASGHNVANGCTHEVYVQSLGEYRQCPCKLTPDEVRKRYAGTRGYLVKRAAKR